MPTDYVAEALKRAYGFAEERIARARKDADRAAEWMNDYKKDLEKYSEIISNTVDELLELRAELLKLGVDIKDEKPNEG